MPRRTYDPKAGRPRPAPPITTETLRAALADMFPRRGYQTTPRGNARR